MSEQQQGAAEEAAGVSDTAGHDSPASSASTPGDADVRVDGAAEQQAGVEDEGSSTAD